MPQRRDRMYRPDPLLEKRAADAQLVLAGNRAKVESALRERNRIWYSMFHAYGYTQRKICEVSNKHLKPDDPDYVTEATVEKALLRMK